jgi:hypothetical protein
MPKVAVREDTHLFKVFFAELVALLHKEGKTASTFLQELYERYVRMWYHFVTLPTCVLLDMVTSKLVSFQADQNYISSLLLDQQ